jgi:hypothetical protein
VFEFDSHNLNFIVVTDRLVALTVTTDILILGHREGVRGLCYEKIRCYN